MPGTDLPRGRYFFGARSLESPPDQGSRAIMGLARLVSEQGLACSILTFDPISPGTSQVMSLRRRGLIGPGVEVLNIYEFYRSHGLSTGSSTGARLDDLSGYRQTVENSADGSPWRTTFTGGRSTVLHDYHRADGSVWLRTPGDPFGTGRNEKLSTVTAEGDFAGEIAGFDAFYSRWVMDLTDSVLPSFLFLQDWSLAPLVESIQDANLFSILMVDRPHTKAPIRWDAALAAGAASAFSRLAEFDGVVFGSDQQLDDVVARYGSRDQFFSLPLAELDSDSLGELRQVREMRKPSGARFVALDGCDKSERVADVVEAFAALHAKVPHAELVIAGATERADELQRRIDDLGLSGSATICPTDSADLSGDLQDATAVIVTNGVRPPDDSLLVAAYAGCPIVGYDVGYLSRELAREGCGYVVAERDVTGLTNAMRRLVDLPEMAAHFGSASREFAGRYLHDAVIQQWSRALRRVLDLKARRVSLDTFGLRICEARLAPVSAETDASGRVEAGDLQLIVDVELTAEISGPDKYIDDLRVGIEAVVVETGERIALPCSVERMHFGRFRIVSATCLRDLANGSGNLTNFRPRVFFVCHNVGWANYVTTIKGAPVQELYHDRYGRLTIRAGNFD